MMRVWSLLLVLGVVLPVRAHFVFLVPGAAGEGQRTVEIYFSEGPTPDNPELLARIAHTRLVAREEKGGIRVVEARRGEKGLRAVIAGQGAQLVGAACRYGVIQRGQSEPFLLEYYAKTALGEQPLATASQTLPELKLDIVPQKGGRAAQVRWQGQPLADAEVVFLAPGKEEVKGKTDKDGMFQAAIGPAPGTYALRARHVEKQAGEHQGKKYSEVRSYATLTLQVGEAAAAGKDAAPARRKEDPEATRLLAEARAARAEWEGFRGFEADLEVNLNGKVQRTPVQVSKDGKVTLKVEGEEADRFARRTLGSLVGHRLPGGEYETPCAFADDDKHNPLGRAIVVLNDEFHSSYRIRDRQVIVVNRTMRDARFTITVLENRQSAEKKFLPSCYVVNYWDLQGNVLRRSEAHHNTWKRVGPYDLPERVLILTATPEGQEARSLTLSNHRLPATSGE